MRKKEITISREVVVNLGNYNSDRIGIGITYELKDNEDVNWDEIWDELNQQIEIRKGNPEQSWLITDEEKKQSKKNFNKKVKRKYKF
ncbi:MAG: hypothetical protein QXY47_05355 [Thermoplasmata archaeon]